MGTGHNKAYITVKADISELANLSGGSYVGDTSGTTGELTFANGNFSGWSMYNPKPTGVQLYGWTTINLTDHSTFTATGPWLQALDTFNIDNTSTLQSLGDLDIRGNDGLTINNSGRIDLCNSKKVGDEWTIYGNYHGDNGRIIFNTTLDGDGSPTDKLVIMGDTSGTTNVHINKVGGSGAQTLQGIEVQGKSEGTFKQDGRIVAGAYDYTLGRGNASNGTSDKNWYLTSFLSPVHPTTPAIRPEAGAYVGLIENQGAFNHSFHDRQQMLDNQYQTVWTRVEYSRTKSKAAGQIDNRNDKNLIQFGTDLY